jgi:hypothetical protein
MARNLADLINQYSEKEKGRPPSNWRPARVVDAPEFEVLDGSI